MELIALRLEPLRPPLSALAERSTGTECADLEQMPLSALLYFVLVEDKEKPRQ